MSVNIAIYLLDNNVLDLLYMHPTWGRHVYESLRCREGRKMLMCVHVLCEHDNHVAQSVMRF